MNRPEKSDNWNQIYFIRLGEMGIKYENLTKEELLEYVRVYNNNAKSDLDIMEFQRKLVERLQKENKKLRKELRSYEENKARDIVVELTKENEQLQEEYKTINTSGLSVMQKLAKANSLNTEFKQRGLK